MTVVAFMLKNVISGCSQLVHDFWLDSFCISHLYFFALFDPFSNGLPVSKVGTYPPCLLYTLKQHPSCSLSLDLEGICNLQKGSVNTAASSVPYLGLCLFFFQSMVLVGTEASPSTEIETILDSDQRDLIGDFSKVMLILPSCFLRG